MPELPEVETICRSLKNNIIGKVINNVIVRKYQLRWSIPANLGYSVKNFTIQTINRRAKYLLIHCCSSLNGASGTIIIHLGMSGRLTITTADTPIKPHDHVDFILGDSILRYNDPRRFGAILWSEQDPYQHRLLAHLGLEPFDKKLNARYLLNKAKSTNATIKQFIMNHKVIVGVGNIYANEALFAANIHPKTLARNLKLKHMEQLLADIRAILKLAIRHGGTTLKDFFAPSGEIGSFFNTLKIYGKNQHACYTCGDTIIQFNLSQRSTFCCTTCQPILATNIANKR